MWSSSSSAASSSMWLSEFLQSGRQKLNAPQFFIYGRNDQQLLPWAQFSYAVNLLNACKSFSKDPQN